MSRPSPGTLLESLNDGDSHATKLLVLALTPTIEKAVYTALRRDTRSRYCRTLREEVEDTTQDVLAILFGQNARILNNWRSERGLSLHDYVSMVARRHTLSKLRSTRSNPYMQVSLTDYALDSIETQHIAPDEAALQRQLASMALKSVWASLSPLGKKLFEFLVIQECDVNQVIAETGMSPDAIYAWRSRLAKRLRVALEKYASSSYQDERSSA